MNRMNTDVTQVSRPVLEVADEVTLTDLLISYLVIYFTQVDARTKSLLVIGGDATACCTIRQNLLPTVVVVRRLKRNTYSSSRRCRYCSPKRPWKVPRITRLNNDVMRWTPGRTLSLSSTWL